MSAIEVLAAQSAPMKAGLAWMFAANFCSRGPGKTRHADKGDNT